MSNRLKDLVAQITKTAQVPPRSKGPKAKPADGAKPTADNAPPSGAVPVPTRSKTGPVAPVGGKAFGSPAIKKMQQAIQTFADTAVKYKTKPEKDASGKIVYRVSEDDNRRNFNDFLAEQFSASADIHGDEYNPDPAANTKDSKLPTDIIQLNNVIDSLRRIGKGSKEALADGVWDFRTNNAVRNVYALATALVAAHNALGGIAPNDSRIFNQSDLTKLKGLIPTVKDPKASGMSQEELSKKAEGITPLVEKLTEFYNYYSSKIMTHPSYKRYITDDIPLMTVQPGKDPAQLDTNQAERLKNSNTIALPYLRVMDKGNKPINVDGKVLLNYLQSRNGLQKMMVALLGYQPNEVNNSAAMRRIVRTFIDRINKIIDQNRPATPVASPQINLPSVEDIKPSTETANQTKTQNIA